MSGIGSLAVGQLRLAGRSDHTVLKGDLEILTLQGSLCSDGSHLHIAVADANGVLDPSTRYPELQIRSRVNRSRLLRWREWCRRIMSR